MSEFSSSEDKQEMSEFSPSNLFKRLKDDFTNCAITLNALIQYLQIDLNFKESSPAIVVPVEELNESIHVVIQRENIADLKKKIEELKAKDEYSKDAKTIEEIQRFVDMCKGEDNRVIGYIQDSVDPSIKSILIPHHQSIQKLVDLLFYRIYDLHHSKLLNSSNNLFSKETVENSDGSKTITFELKINFSLWKPIRIPNTSSIKILSGSNELFITSTTGDEIDSNTHMVEVDFKDIRIEVSPDGVITAIRIKHWRGDSDYANLEQFLGMLTDHKILYREEGVWLFNEVTPEQYESTFRPFISGLSSRGRLFRAVGKGYEMHGEQHEDSEEEDVQKEA